jgi:hypothetical protein
MSFILFYSNYCKNCSVILQQIANSNVKNNIHFISIDNRIKKPDGSIYIILKNQKEIILPHTVDRVPALLLLNRGNQVLFGNSILEQLVPVKSGIEKRMANQDPSAFSLNEVNCFGVFSDNYSFLDQSSDELSAKGGGGMRQLRNNVPWDYNDTIDTPPEDYIPNTVGEVSIEQLKKQRESSIK